MEYKNLVPFPKDFLWGASTAAYQCEGGYLSDGKTLSVVDLNINPNFADTSVTSDHYNKFEEDILLMRELGLKAYRFSIAWPRIIPNGDNVVNPKGIEFYNKIIDLLIENKIEPIVTIYHFDLPQVLQEKYGGWSSRNILEDFEFYCKVLFENFGDRVKCWLTINEQSNMFLLPYLMIFDKSKPLEKQKYEMNHIMTLAHAKAVVLCHKMLPNAKIGPAIGLSPNYPEKALPEDILAARTADNFKTYLFTDLYFRGEYRADIWKYMIENDCAPTIEDGDLELLKSAKSDYVGINYYCSTCVRYPKENSSLKEAELDKDGIKIGEVQESFPALFETVSNNYLSKTKWGWSIDPIGLRVLLNELHERYNIPVIITENGMGEVDVLEEDGTINDEYRIDYYKKHLHQLRLAMSDGVKVIGYCPWSYIDLLSTTSGFRKRYGFVYVNRTDDDLKDLKRIKKKSFYWYSDVIKENGSTI